MITDLKIWHMNISHRSSVTSYVCLHYISVNECVRACVCACGYVLGFKY